MFKVQPRFLTACVMWAAIGFLTACAVPLTPATPTPAVSRLRIVNSGRADITGLVVLFPGPTSLAEARRVVFGDVPAGQMTEYRDVPGGVYRYAAYEYTLAGRVVTQPVMDWVGESPLAGGLFTYRLELDLQKEPGGQMQLRPVVTDSP